MIQYVETLLKSLRPAFSRQATFVWLGVVFAGFVVRTDAYGVSSIVRALGLDPLCYECLVNFFHSTAWNVETFLACWRQWWVQEDAVCRIGGRIVFIGDHTKTPKDGRRIPAVGTLHQDSETASKPSFFRGHHWGCIGLLLGQGRFSAAPLWAEIHHEDLNETRSTRIVTVAGRIANEMKQSAFLVLDAFFAVGPVFRTAAQCKGLLHIVTRAKKNAVGYLPAPPRKKKGPGRPRVYGKKLVLVTLFDTLSSTFTTVDALVYNRKEKVRYLSLNLLWKPTKGMLRFILIESSRGRIVVMTSDLSLDPLVALDLYGHRVAIETLFDTLKNMLGGMRYHFWSKYLQAASRRPAKKGSPKPTSSRPEKTKNTLVAIHKFLAVHLVVVGTLQLLARRFASEIHSKAHCWLRTPCGDIPSEFVARAALANIIRSNLTRFRDDWMTSLIHSKQNNPENTKNFNQAA